MNLYGIFAILIFVLIDLAYVLLQHPSTEGFPIVPIIVILAFFGVVFSVQIKASLLKFIFTVLNIIIFFTANTLWMLMNN